MKTIFITGASSGLGKATAQLFQANGWKVIATMRNPEKETEITQLANVTILPFDVTNPLQIEEIVNQLTETTTVDVVFNNAGYGLIGALEACSTTQIVDQINTNLIGVINVTKAFIPHFKTNKNGLFITTSSVCGFSSNPLSPVYNATKWAIEGFSESISYDLATFNTGIKTIAAGGIKSNFMSGMQVAINPDYDSLNQKLSEFFNDGTLMEFTDVEIIAKVVFEAATDGKDQLRYLAGDDARRIDEQRTTVGRENYRINLRDRLGLKAAKLG